MKLLALVKNPAIMARTLATLGEALEGPRRSPARGPPYWKSPCYAGTLSVTRTRAQGVATRQASR